MYLVLNMFTLFRLLVIFTLRREYYFMLRDDDFLINKEESCPICGNLSIVQYAEGYQCRHCEYTVNNDDQLAFLGDNAPKHIFDSLLFHKLVRVNLNTIFAAVGPDDLWDTNFRLTDVTFIGIPSLDYDDAFSNLFTMNIPDLNGQKLLYFDHLVNDDLIPFIVNNVRWQGSNCNLYDIVNLPVENWLYLKHLFHTYPPVTKYEKSVVDLVCSATLEEMLHKLHVPEFDNGLPCVSNTSNLLLGAGTSKLLVSLPYYKNMIELEKSVGMFVKERLSSLSFLDFIVPTANPLQEELRHYIALADAQSAMDANTSDLYNVRLDEVVAFHPMSPIEFNEYSKIAQFVKAFHCADAKQFDGNFKRNFLTLKKVDFEDYNVSQKFWQYIANSINL